MGGKAPLAKFGVDIEAVDHDGKTALHRAAMFSDTDKVRPVNDRTPDTLPRAMHLWPVWLRPLVPQGVSERRPWSTRSCRYLTLRIGAKTFVPADCMAAGQRAGFGGTGHAGGYSSALRSFLYAEGCRAAAARPRCACCCQEQRGRLSSAHCCFCNIYCTFLSCT